MDTRLRHDSGISLSMSENTESSPESERPESVESTDECVEDVESAAFDPLSFINRPDSQLNGKGESHSLVVATVLEEVRIFRHRVSDGCIRNSFGIVCVCGCVYCPSVSLSRPNGQTYRLDIWHVGQVGGYLGQVRRS